MQRRMLAILAVAALALAVSAIAFARPATSPPPKASIHNFVLEQQSGGKFEQQLTTVPFKGTKSVTLTLTKGKWKFYCAPHESSMFGFFVVK